MKLASTSSHGRGEAVVYERALAGIYAEAREVVLATRVKLASERAKNGLRAIHDRVLREFAGRGWKIGERIFPPFAPATIQRGHYRLDAWKRTGSGGTLGIICHFGSSEFLVCQLMLISEAVRRGIVDCGVLALMTRDLKPYVSGRPA